MSIGEKIYELRIKANISQETMALDLGVSRQAVSKWETNQSIPDLSNLKMIANYFNVSLSDLIDEKIDNVIIKPKELPILNKLNKGINILLIIASSFSCFLFLMFLLIVVLQKPLVGLLNVASLKNYVFVFPIFDFIGIALLTSFIIVMSIKIILKKNLNTKKIAYEIVCIVLCAILFNTYTTLPSSSYKILHTLFDNAQYALSYSAIKSLLSFIQPNLIISCFVFVTGVSISLVTKLFINK